MVSLALECVNQKNFFNQRSIALERSNDCHQHSHHQLSNAVVKIIKAGDGLGTLNAHGEKCEIFLLILRL